MCYIIFKKKICKNFEFPVIKNWDKYSQRQLLFTTRLSAAKIFQIYSSQGNYLQLDNVD